MNSENINWYSTFIVMLFFMPVLQVINGFSGGLLFQVIPLQAYTFLILIISFWLLLKIKKIDWVYVLFLLLITYQLCVSLPDYSYFNVVGGIVLVINSVIIFFSDKFEDHVINQKVVKWVFLIILIGFLAFLIGVDTTKGVGYHAGAFDSPHVAANSLFIIFMYCLVKFRKLNVLGVISAAFIFLTGVRTIMVATAFVYAVFLIVNITSGNLKNRARHTSYLILVLLIFFVFSSYYLASFDRLSDLVSETDADNYGSGRIAIARLVLEDFFHRDLVDQLFGKSIPSLFNLTAQYFGGSGIWTHNDFTMMLYSFGIIGLLIYIYYVVIYIWRWILKNRMYKFQYYLYLYLAIFFLANANGFLNYKTNIILLYLFTLARVVGRDKK